MEITLKTGTETADEAVAQIARLQSGEVECIPTGISHLDEALMGGLLPGTVVTIAGLSGHGKSYTMERAQRHIMKNTPNVIILSCAWELEALKIISRDLSYQLKKTVKEVLFEKPKEDEIEDFKKVIDRYRREGLYFQPEPVAAEQFETDVMYLIEKYKDQRIVVTIDNLENILVDTDSQKVAMDKLLYRINVLKKRHPFISFIILNQMNYDYVRRSSDLKQHRPLSSDLYATGQLFKLSDAVVFTIIPSRIGIQDKFMVIGQNAYEHLEEHKIPATTNTTSFDPFGKVFYFYLKAREVDEKTFKDIHIETMYTREECGVKAISVKKVAPKFDVPVIESPVINLSPAIENNKGKGFEDSPF